MAHAVPVGAIAAQANRTAEIANTIRAALSPIIDADAVKADAQSEFQAAVADATGTRLSVIVALANASRMGAWTQSEIATAVVAAGKVGNAALPKSVATFVAEAKRAMSPKVRDYAPAIVGVVGIAWEAEGEQDKDAPRPLRKAFKRQYHCVLQAFGLAEDGTVLRETTDVLDWARARDPDLDYGKVYDRLQAIRKELTAFAADFPVDGFVEVDAFLSEITKERLKACREAIAQRDDERLAGHKLTDVPVPEIDPIPDELSMPEIDPIADALGELDAGMSLASLAA